MDAFLGGGLDSRLRMSSVKVADSMMGLVNTAMEDAYKKSLWKDGDLERLFQKLRFAELAIVQLEWCLRFVRGEMEGDDGHEQLLDELLETRDQIQTRLDEAELAVADRDRDYMRWKHEELSSSRRETAPPADPERAGPGRDREDGCPFRELKGSVDRKMARMRIKLEDARSILAALMQKVSGEASPMARLQEAGHESDGVKGLSGFYGMAQLLMEFQEMVLDAGAVRDSVASSFDVMSRSVSSLRVAMDEQRWLANAEKEMYGAVFEGFLREINVESPVLKDGSSRTPTENTWGETETLNDETVLLQSATRVPESSDNGHYLHSEEPDVSQEEVEKLLEEKIASDMRRELHDVLYTAMFRDLCSELGVMYEVQKLKEELDMRSKLQYEIYTIASKHLATKLATESVEHLIRTFIKDEVHTVVVAKTLNEWKSTAEMLHNEKLIKEEIDCIVFRGLAKHLTCNVRSVDEVGGSNNLGRFSTTDNFEQLQKMKTRINVTSDDKAIDSNKHPVPVKQDILSCSDNSDVEDSKECDLQAETSTDNDRVADRVNGTIGQVFEQTDQRKLRTEDVALSLSILPIGENLENGLVALTPDKKLVTRHLLASTVKIGEHDQLELQNLQIPITNLQKISMDFEAVIGEKIGTAILRFRDLDEQLASLVEQVSSLKRSELIFRRAFSRRCHDLQTAETEVDLLGDEVELLLGLLSKTHKALDHYSPVLQHYAGVRETLKLLGKELAERHQVQ